MENLTADKIVAVIIVVYLIAYKYYGSFIEKKVFQADDSNQTPAQVHNDGQDFLPTRKTILFGHHFASIAGVAPIIGPCIAVYWGWLPAVIWVVLGNIFMGAVHDMAVLFLSVRNSAKSIVEIAASKVMKGFFDKPARFGLLYITIFLLWIVSAAFTVVIARLFVKYPSAVIPTVFASFLAVAMGFILYKSKIHALVPSLVSLVLLYVSIPVGVAFPIDFQMLLSLSADQALALWVIILLVYAYIASVLPVWVLLQPRDYINSHQIVVALGILLFGVFVTKPEIVAPAINFNADKSWFPFLFITIACGAISGAHGLISAGTTSKQIAKETDIRPIAYGSMLLEGFLAILAVVAASAGFKNKEEWCAHYHSWHNASTNGLDAFINGCVSFLKVLNLPEELLAAFIAVIIISFASTSLDTLFRIQRYILAESSDLLKTKFFENRYNGSIVAFIAAALLIFSEGIIKMDISKVNGAFVLWPLFGTANQLLAALALLVVSVYLIYRKKNFWYTLIPAGFMIILTLYAVVNSIVDFYNEGNYLLLFFSVLVLVSEFLVIKPIFMNWKDLRIH
jgi:carbon starvation protein